MYQNAQRPVGIWLLICAFFIGMMVIIGGITRLTGSGLSITEWDLIMGAIPPTSDMQWEALFHKYQQTPEYEHVNYGMSLDDFKSIFWWEYIHRLVGRALGFLFLIPLIIFWVQKRIDKLLGFKLLGLFVLGGLQGLLGWYMVKSGLVSDPHVSHLRLTSHLILAFALFGATLWLAFNLLQPRWPGRHPQSLWIFVLVLGCVIFIQVALGGMVAGLKAGHMFNTFPKMGRFWIPPGMTLDPINNGVTMQFLHRLTGYVVFAMIIGFWWHSRKFMLSRMQQNGVWFMLGMGLVQVLLGIFTLLLNVPVWLGVLHQTGALVLFGGVIYAAHTLRPENRDVTPVTQMA